MSRKNLPSPLTYCGTLVWEPEIGQSVAVAALFVRNRHGNFIVSPDEQPSGSVYLSSVVKAARDLTFDKTGKVLNRKAERCAISCPKGINRSPL